jgi:hypothetical protein
MIMVTSQADCLQLGTADTELSPWREERPVLVAKMPRVRDVTGESTDILKGSCSQNTLKNKRMDGALELQAEKKLY